VGVIVIDVTATEDAVREDLSEIEVVVNATEVAGKGVDDRGERDGVGNVSIAVVVGGDWLVEVADP
jgi:hypothetical protein